jgi:hypothetical protein
MLMLLTFLAVTSSRVDGCKDTPSCCLQCSNTSPSLLLQVTICWLHHWDAASCIAVEIHVMFVDGSSDTQLQRSTAAQE